MRERTVNNGVRNGERTVEREKGLERERNPTLGGKKVSNGTDGVKNMNL